MPVNYSRIGKWVWDEGKGHNGYEIRKTGCIGGYKIYHGDWEVLTFFERGTFTLRGAHRLIRIRES